MRNRVRALGTVAFFLGCLIAALAPVSHRSEQRVTAATTEPPAPTNAPVGGLFAETFAGATTAPANTFYYQAAGNPPCLTARATYAPGATAPPSGTTLPGCANGDPAGFASPLPDPAATGTLRMTDNAGNQAGFVLYNKAFASGAGAQIVFKYWAYNGSGADGIAVFLIDGSLSPTVAGAYGGSLGYAQRNSPSVVAGIAGGVVGIGIDEFGNYSAATEGRNGGPGAISPAVAIRGNAAGNYVYIGGTGNGGIPSLPMALAFPGATTRAGATPRLIRFTLGSLGVITVDVSFTGLPANYVNAIPPQTLTGQTIPNTLKIGFTGSTGGSTDIHEIQGLYGDPAPADPAIAMTQNVSSFTASGQAVTYTISPTNSGAGGIENKLVTVTDVLPAGVTYVSAVGLGWTCNYTAGTKTVACTYPANSNTAAGTSYNNITIATTLAATSGAVVNTATIASSDDLYYGNDSASSTGQYVPASAPAIQIFKRIVQILTLGPTPGPTTTARLLTETTDAGSLSGVAGTATSTPVFPGDYILYGLYFKNTGPIAAQAISGSGLTGPTISDTVDSNYIFDINYTPAPTFSCCVSPTTTMTAPYSYNAVSKTLSWTMSTPLPASSPSPSATNPVQGSITYTVKVP